jgi:hypothetical protein
MRSIPCAQRPFLLATLACLGACSAPQLDVMPRVSQSKLDGTVSVQGGGMSIADNDLDKDLGLGETSTEFGGRADLDFGGETVTLAYSPGSFSGNGTLKSDIDYNGTTIPAATNVASSVDLNLGSLLWTHDFVPSDTVEAGIGLGVQYVDFKSRVTSTDAGTPGTVDLSESVPLPVLVVRGGVAFGPVDFSALASGVEANYNGNDAKLFDLDVLARWRILGNSSGHLSGALIVGFHHTKVDADYTNNSDRVKADMTVSGMYYGLSIGF